MEQLDYSPVLKALKLADQDFTEKHGVAHYSLFDAALEEAAKAYNRENGTDYDPVEARHQYLELCESEPNPFALEQVVVDVEDLITGKPENRSIH
ncbi:hypothetical protein [Rheinheimera hassiensis]|uniref:hypothetical protein n=1 Tax=Rheinheimera hassiensis TaxID=1193627 RepID=UPI001F055830|nr:hypothetical protein [Rheinheimera hassiensis]